MKFKYFGEVVDSEEDEMNPIEYEDHKIGENIHKFITVNDDSIIDTMVSIVQAFIDEFKENRELGSEEIRIFEDLIQFYDYNFTDYGEYESEPYEITRVKNMLDKFHSHRPKYLEPNEVHVDFRYMFGKEGNISYYYFCKKQLDNGLYTFVCPVCKEGEFRFHHSDWDKEGIEARCNQCEHNKMICCWKIDPKTDRIRLPIWSYNFSSTNPEEVKKSYLATPIFAVFPANER